MSKTTFDDISNVVRAYMATAMPKPMAARIISLCAASMPSTSKVGSASA